MNVQPQALAADEVWLLREAVAGASLVTRFQPILDLRSGRVFGYEALSAGPSASPISSAEALFTLARRWQAQRELEAAAARLALQRFSALGLEGRLFINLSATALAEDGVSAETLATAAREAGLTSSAVVIELTESDPLGAGEQAWDALLAFRKLGFGIAIDDLGEGFSSLRLWSQVRPEFVKVDRHFIDGVSRDSLKLVMTRALAHIAEGAGSQLIAEGIEHESDFHTVRDLGLRFGQGWLIARPAERPSPAAAEKVWGEMSGRPVSAFPEPSTPVARVTARRILRIVEPVTPRTDNDTVFARFEADADLQALPVVERGRPVGLINRHSLIDRFARPYRRELFGKRSCTGFMSTTPVIVEVNTGIQEISLRLAQRGQNALADGFIVVEQGAYLGVGTGTDLMREITEQQILAARYANPLTLLPGNVPIAQHVERLISLGVRFVVAYADLDHFKPFNDVYGYQRGDEAIQLTAKALTEACTGDTEFVGHVGGDDFVVVLQSEDWEARLQQALVLFGERVGALFGDEDVARGYFEGEDRQGRRQQFPMLALSIGALVAESGEYAGHHEIAGAATEAKKLAKRMSGNSLFVERRRGPQTTLRPADGAVSLSPSA